MGTKLEDAYGAGEESLVDVPRAKAFTSHTLEGHDHLLGAATLRTTIQVAPDATILH